MKRVKTLNENISDFFILGNMNELIMLFIRKFVVCKEQERNKKVYVYIRSQMYHVLQYI